MALKTSQYKGYECDGRNVRLITEVFRLFPATGLRPLVTRGIGKVGLDGRLVVDAAGWYPMEAWVGALHEIYQNVGPSKMFEIGKQIPKVAVFPPGVTDVHSALRLTDTAYHMNFRREGRLMFDPATGQMLEGIGHYTYVSQPDPRRIVMECDNPFPCDFDRGIIVALVARFEPNAAITHLDEATCRARDAARCCYSVTW